jgi:hypothetical protein
VRRTGSDGTTEVNASKYDRRDMASRVARSGPAPTSATGRVPIPIQLWPLVALSVGLPPLYLLGLASFAWALPGVAFGAALLLRKGVKVPRGGGILLALVVWTAVSGIQLHGITTLALFGYRWSLFLSLAMAYIWVCNVPRDEVSDAAIIRVVGWTWPVLVAFAGLALLLPDVSSPSVLLRTLPAGLANHQLMVDLSSLRFAEIQRFLGYPVPRPSAPFAYANTWGSALALTLPFFVLDRVVGQSRARRATGVLVLALAVVPIVVSLNRGLWLSGAAAVAYVAIRRALSGDLRTFVRFAAAAAVAVALVLASPLGGLISDRFERAADSNESRESVAYESLKRGAESPLLGFGAPQLTDDAPVPVGSHGLLWYLVYAHGFVAAGLFLAWLLGALRRGLALTTDQGMWLTTVLVMTLIQILIYDMLPHVVLLGVAAGLLWRSRRLTWDERARMGEEMTTERV